MNKDDFALRDELLEQCNGDVNAAYALSNKIIAEYYSKAEAVREPFGEFKVWFGVRELLACQIADKCLLQDGYERKYTKEDMQYFSKPERKEEEHGTDEK